jgi:hypothetical protein
MFLCADTFSIFMSLYINTYGIHFFSTKVVSSNPDHGEAYSIQHYVIKFVSDLVFLISFSFAMH